MKPLLIDTNVVSILFRQSHPLRGQAFEAMRDKNWFISFMTRAELLVWPRLNNWGPARREELERHAGMFTTLLPDDDSPRYWADVVVESRRLGRPMSAADAWIAATAMQWELPLVTNNVGDFEHLGQLTLLRI
jgi:predicted nucleic acid-binding protein